MNRNFYFIFILTFLFLNISQAKPNPKYLVNLSNNWEIEGDLPTQALLISLQGLANQNSPVLYFLYPPEWDYTFCEPLQNYYRDSRKMEFTTLKSVEAVLEQLSHHAKGYIVWDKSVRTSLIVAFTAAGLHQSVVVSEEIIPLVKKYGLKKMLYLKA